MKARKGIFTVLLTTNDRTLMEYKLMDEDGTFQGNALFFFNETQGF